MLEAEQKVKFGERALQFWNGFVSLIWLDGSINFIFRFIAKTSELLLAIGIVISAADFLTDGRLMHNNLMLANAWAWTQSIAIESSGGVVLMYALQSFKDKDKVKGWLYLILAFMLAVVGGTMLLTQIIYNTTGINVVTQGPLWFIIVMAAARTVVSIAYIVMCRIKHIRLSDLEVVQENQITMETPPVVDIKSEIDQAVNSALASALQRLEDMHHQQFEVVLQEMKRTVVEEVTQHKLLAMPKHPAMLEAPKTATPALQPDRLAIVKNALIANPTIKDKELATLAMCSVNTARKWKAKAQNE